MNKKTLIIVDPQYDFMPGGNLAVKDGNLIIPVINKLINSGFYNMVIITQDWHSTNHKSFASQHKGKKPFEITNLNGIEQVLWPDHCMQETHGAMFHRDLNLNNANNLYFIKKGYNDEVDSYSGFYDNDHKTSTGLSKLLSDNKITDIDICGLAYDYCVAYTAIDSVKEGFNTRVIVDATKAISDNILPTSKLLTDNNISLIQSDYINKKYEN